MTKTKTKQLYPGMCLYETCPDCGWMLYVYYRSKTYKPDELMPPVDEVPMWWQTVCLCGHRDYEQPPSPVQLSLELA